VLEAVTKLCAADEKIVTICEKGDKLLEEEISKVYRGKKIVKGNELYALPGTAFPPKGTLWSKANLIPRHIASNYSFTLLFRHTIHSS
jgi:hypothetical protein